MNFFFSTECFFGINQSISINNININIVNNISIQVHETKENELIWVKEWAMIGPGSKANITKGKIIGESSLTFIANIV